MVFGLPPGVVVHDACMANGAARCTFTVTWVKHSRLPWKARRQRRDHEIRESSDVNEQVESLQETATDLVTAGDVDTTLQRIATRARSALRAHRHLLVVRPEEHDELHVHAEGFSVHEAEIEAARVLAVGLEGLEDKAPERIVADVASARRHYGYLVAYAAVGGSFFDDERRLLRSYARYAAAALDAATALEQANRRRETATVLLDLARGLAKVTSVEEAAAQLCLAVPAVVGADRAQVFLWEPRTTSARVVGSYGWPDHLVAAFDSLVLRPSDTPEFEHMLGSPGLRCFDRSTEDGFIRGLLEAFGGQAMITAPIVARDELLGVLVVDWAEGRPAPVFDSHLRERLTSLADQGASAISNTRLLEQVIHQARHDPLTGLANRALFEDRAQQALRSAVRAPGRAAAIIFIDLDRFKAVNDSFGHHLGDELLRAVADRLRQVVRDADTLARVGGDEFTVLLPEVQADHEAEEVGARVFHALRAPFTLDSTSVSIGASIGVAVSREGDSYEDLLCAADAAMYRAKSRGGERVEGTGS